MKRVLPLLALFVAAAVQAQYSGLTADLRLDQNQLMPDEDMQLKVRVINRSGQPVTLGQDDQWVTFIVQGDDGYVAPKRGDLPAKGEFTLLSGQSGTRTFNPTPYFDFRRPGHYRISATVRIPQWNQEMECRPVSFVVADGVPLPNLANLPVGLPSPPGVSNAPPVVRRYSLIKVIYLSDLTLYFRLTDDGGQTLRVFPLARMLSFSVPEAQVDRSNNLHVLFQTGARTFSYFVMNTDGRLVARQTQEYTGTRPTLRFTEDGQVFVAGGVRRYLETDIPAPVSVSASGP